MERIIEVKHLSKSLGDHKVLRDIDFSVNKGEVVCIIGSSGSGKSTLLNLLAQRLELDSGVFTIGETVRLAYYTQENEAMDGDKRMIAYLQEAAEAVTRQDGTQMSVAELLERFLFPRHVHGTKLGKLSGVKSVACIY